MERSPLTSKLFLGIHTEYVEALEVIESAWLGGIECYRRVSIDYGLFNSYTAGLLLAGTAAMARRTAKTQKDLKRLVRKFDSTIQSYFERTGKTVGPATLASVLANMLGPTTHRDFLKEEVLDNYREMRQRILDVAVEARDRNGVVVEDDDESEETDPDEDPDAIDAVTNKMRRQKGSGKCGSRLSCWHCTLKGHRASDGPNMRSPPAPGSKIQKEWRQASSQPSKASTPSRGTISMQGKLAQISEMIAALAVTRLQLLNLQCDRAPDHPGRLTTSPWPNQAWDAPQRSSHLPSS